MNSKPILLTLAICAVLMAIAAEGFHPAYAAQASFIQPTPTPGPKLIAQQAKGLVPAKPVKPTPFPTFIDHFTTTLSSGQWQKYSLGPSTAFHGGYVVDITPLNPSTDGAHIEHKIIPEFDGIVWNDMLWMILPEETKPLRVRVQVFSTADWPVAAVIETRLEPGVLHGFGIQEAKAEAGYVIDINPSQPGSKGDSFQQAFVQPEFPGPVWLEVLRLQIYESQEPLHVVATVYKTPETLPVAAEYDVHLNPGDWIGYVVGASKERTGYVMEVTPLIEEDNQILTYRVQPEFDGRQWNDVARLMIPADRPLTEAHVRVYAVTK